MSIKDLVYTRERYIRDTGENYQAEVHIFMNAVINTFKDIQKQLAQKENTIAVKDIKEVRLLNGDICGLCFYYEINTGFCALHPAYGELVRRDCCDDFKEGD